MRYVLGIDVGGSRTTAAVSRYNGDAWDEAQPLTLDGDRFVESVLYLSPDGVLAGREARQAGSLDPSRLASGFLRRIGDDVPYVLGDVYYGAETLTAALAGWVADRAAEQEGGEPTRIAVTHPPDWGGYRRSLLHDALDAAGLPGALLLPSPVAVAEDYRARAELEAGAVLAVCRVGGEQVESTALRRTSGGFELLGQSSATDPLGGTRLDDLVSDHVLGRLGAPEPGPGELVELRLACIAAKERLSAVAEVTVPVPFAPVGGILLHRAEFERLVRPTVEMIVAQLNGIVAAVPGDRLAAVVPAGGGARVPLVTQLLQDALDCAVDVEADPGHALCRGAAVAARPPARARVLDEQPRPSTSLVTQSRELPIPSLDDDAELGEPPPRPPVEITPLHPPRQRFGRGRRAAATSTETTRQKT
ncbi:Hsp70 protein [Amycolatopsis marina]|uniref:Hsp70 protein n=1 Tax=Amycolatopsis marina TaxID=490629 RepID=A0A1I0V8Z2_9PSEU|nr:Hsp70 family protein [Amycolatopsis marina]SFA72513.1 Hsp70 protein [Amycolatopsis marina]